MFVAMPTAMPLEPLRRRFGSFAGRTVGSSSVSSKFGIMSTVSFSRSARSSSVTRCILTSVYRIAAAPSPSIEPKLP